LLFHVTARHDVNNCGMYNEEIMQSFRTSGQIKRMEKFFLGYVRKGFGAGNRGNRTVTVAQFSSSWLECTC